VRHYADRALKKFDLTTQGVQVLAEVGAQTFHGGTWNADGVILFPISYTSPIYMLRLGPEGVADSRRVTNLDVSREIGHTFPRFLPDGNHFLYYVNGNNPGVSGTHLGSLDGSVSKRLLPSDSTAVYSEPGRLLFVREGTLFAQIFRPRVPHGQWRRVRRYRLAGCQ